MKILSSAFILAGALWGLSMYWMTLVMDGVAQRVSVSPIGAALVAGPILLVCGPVLVLAGFHAKFGSILTLLGCAVLTADTGYGVSGLFAMSWLDAKPFLALFGVLIPVTLLCDEIGRAHV